MVGKITVRERRILAKSKARIDRNAQVAEVFEKGVAAALSIDTMTVALALLAAKQLKHF